MPIYEYQCKKCGEEFEKMVRFSDANQTQTCPTCLSQDTKKKISAFAALGGSISNISVSSGASCGSHGGFS